MDGSKPIPSGWGSSGAAITTLSDGVGRHATKSTGAKTSERRTPGINKMAEAMRFFMWMNELHAIPKPERIRARFGVSRATSYRWLQAWRDALALPDPHTERSTRHDQ